MQALLKRYWWTVFFILLLVWGLFSLLEPPPPKKILMASGSAGGEYSATADVYKSLLANIDVDVEVLNTSGSVDNLARLMNGEVDVAIVQSGVANPNHRESLYSLGAIYYEPLWVFKRSEIAIEDLRGLIGSRVAVGAMGSGARVLSDVILSENGLDADSVELIEASGADAAQQLLEGRVDAAFLVAGPQASWIKKLIRTPGVELVSIDRSLAYARRHPYLKDVVLPDGALSLKEDLPAQDVKLISPVAQIVVKKDLHPAIQAVLLEAMTETHKFGALLNSPETFPTPLFADLPISKEASRYYERGPSFLRRYFPFGLANFLDRAWVLLIPLITLMVPIVRAGPPIYRWRIRRKIYVWYRDLRTLEAEGRQAQTDEERLKTRLKLSELQAETGKVEVPDSYTDDLYRLRAHIRFVAELLDKQNLEDAAAWI
ncbi:TAXI family TRAP transporter solute-binding subunit [Hirschia maritima]|uniref:TAXI family TRAP transporter solute-binding subunit n=1 Tax=Hirschia maritima TaxID=1121961 RepID=UPI000476134B|nr:TAXI family TRAP transporter solute-binding subunit [Hirschia maritima]